MSPSIISFLTAKRRFTRHACIRRFAGVFACLSLAGPALATKVALPAVDEDIIVKAHTAFLKHDRARLAVLRQGAIASAHPLAMWADYWDLHTRLAQARQADVDAFFTRWSGTYVEDRLRSDWVLELGKRRDWARMAQETPRLRVIEDREVACYALLMRHQAGEDVSAQGRQEWFAQREADHGCAQLAAALVQSGRLTRADLWARARVAAEQNRRFVAQHALGLLSPGAAAPVREVFLRPTAFLARRPVPGSDDEAELSVLALIRLAARSQTAAAAAMTDRRVAALPPSGVTAAWAAIGKQAAMGGRPQALGWYERAAAVPGAGPSGLSDDTLAWQVRAALRAEGALQRWPMIVAAVDAMSPAQRDDPAWMYWKARALKAMAPAGPEGDAGRRAAGALFAQVAGRLHFYGKLAADELGRDVVLPPAPQPLSSEERAAAAAHPGLTRALALLALHLREPADDEWNHSLAGMDDRALLAAAQRACDAQAWSRCMRTSERTRNEIDMQQRFPTPFREHVQAVASEVDIDAAYVYGVMRQESHFSAGVRSIAGASGLMQVMPHTARWTARKYRIPYRPEWITDPATNVRIGTHYLKFVLDGFGGSQLLAAAAYNAGPSRPRRWHSGGEIDTAAWTESIPLPETRDYVKGVLANSTYYAALMRGERTASARQAEVPHLDAAQLQVPVSVAPVPQRR